jgi:hypothetical protein
MGEGRIQVLSFVSYNFLTIKCHYSTAQNENLCILIVMKYELPKIITICALYNAGKSTV